MGLRCNDEELEEEQIDFTFSKEEDEGVTTKKNVKDCVFTRLNPIVDTLVDALPAAALRVEVSPIDAPKFDAPIIPSETCVAQDEQLCSQATAAVSEEWQTV
ncbi:hypothetical protein NC651_000090 [Populus alba x Populus x berolinensis]|nr:hypothetical protein NC651_000090 [Populus alba x Populus x berolinensis]